MVEKLDCRRLARRAEPEDADAVNMARRNRMVASAGRLLEVIRETFAAVDARDPAWTTQRCWACGLVETFDKAAELTHNCGGCGEVWDQDYNAARVLLALHCGRLGPPPAT